MVAGLDTGTDSGNKYEILRVVNRGGMGEIALARVRGSKGFEKLVVLKRLRADAERDDHREMFDVEAEVMSKIEHPNIVQVFDQPRINGVQYLAMGYVRGRNLDQVIRRTRQNSQRIAPAFTLTVMGEVLRGLAFVHRLKDDQGRALGVVHQDITPSNILVSFFGEVKVTDFGIAYVTSRDGGRRSGMLKGKPRYVAPEVLAGRRVNNRADIYGVGVVLYELLAGRALFARASLEETLAAVARNELPDFKVVFPHLNEGVHKLMYRALAKDPNDRYRTCEEMHADLATELGRVNGALSPPRLGYSMRQWFVGDPDVPEVDAQLDAALATEESSAGGARVRPPPSLDQTITELDKLLGMDAPSADLFQLPPDIQRELSTIEDAEPFQALTPIPEIALTPGGEEALLRSTMGGLGMPSVPSLGVTPRPPGLGGSQAGQLGGYGLGFGPGQPSASFAPRGANPWASATPGPIPSTSPGRLAPGGSPTAPPGPGPSQLPALAPAVGFAAPNPQAFGAGTPSASFPHATFTPHTYAQSPFAPQPNPLPGAAPSLGGSAPNATPAGVQPSPFGLATAGVVPPHGTPNPPSSPTHGFGSSPGPYDASRGAASVSNGGFGAVPSPTGGWFTGSATPSPPVAASPTPSVGSPPVGASGPASSGHGGSGQTHGGLTPLPVDADLQAGLGSASDASVADKLSRRAALRAARGEYAYSARRGDEGDPRPEPDEPRAERASVGPGHPSLGASARADHTPFPPPPLAPGVPSSNPAQGGSPSPGAASMGPGPSSLNPSASNPGLTHPGFTHPGLAYAAGGSVAPPPLGVAGATPPPAGAPPFGTPPASGAAAPFAPPPMAPGQPGGYAQGGYPQAPAGYAQGGYPQAPAGYAQGGYPQAPAGYAQGGSSVSGYPGGGTGPLPIPPLAQTSPPEPTTVLGAPASMGAPASAPGAIQGTPAGDDGLFVRQFWIGMSVGIGIGAGLVFLVELAR
jgi:serine/threonine protein kinase